MTTAIILAAGEGKRIGQPKALLRHDGATLLENVISIYFPLFFQTSPLVKTIIAVINRKVADELIKASIFCELESKGIRFVINDQIEKGQLHSIHLGIQACDSVPRKTRTTLKTRNHLSTGILLHPVDHPFVQTTTIRIILKHHAPDRIIIPVHQGRRGHPPCFGAETIPILFDAPSDEGARWVYRTHADQIDHLDVSDPGILINVNNKNDLIKRKNNASV